ncbi:phosphate ABC transporter permease PstA [Nitrosomonas ureae]|uniref:Phosphate transport system permease protein PstA n=1 Tax=Nitrosomonas ureae TaxID=44577 RepID=A0A0S3AJ21_9PROT|nr:phosphate ABC transporter permease PstA [Nitrosomonas ureae]ALQ50936.1 phosphate ABC transporter permease [Nitrosomonas ureae]PTQ87560.1 phosphate ABC transporter membrane protein 2 (PhoT family) [Nitrosomonas ureae]SDT85172.1 phosphate ABC transporter membrane protein 2, PhoT family [Nitrosomonas ureae]SEQ23234.1 phosphate transport system permease protein [Nitrosomonas ureae]SOD16336.1 phosphate ABC transporter membrane protein 2, PhoT family [Nitrosomonas ureae]
MRSGKSLEEIRRIISLHKRWDLIFMITGIIALMIAIMTFVALFAHMLIDGLPRLSWEFFTSFPSRRPESAGILSAWVGTTLVMLVTAVAAVPLGIGSGIYLEEYAPRNLLTEIIEINVTNLAGVPSIIYGLLALGLFVYQLGFGQSILAAGLALALLILPVVIVATREAIRSIPITIREGAYALGATKWQTVSDHLLPYSAAGILTGIIIGLARAIGETAPIITIGALTFIAFLPPSPVKNEFPFISFEWLTAPFTVMPIQMFNWVSRPEEAFQLNAAAAGLVLVIMTLAMNGLAIYLRYRMRKNIKW